MFSLSSLGLVPETIKILFVFYFIFGLVSVILSLTLYVLMAVSVYKMSKPFGFRGRWFAFVPYFSDYAYGRLAGATIKQKSDFLAKLLLFLNIIASAFFMISALLCSLSVIDLVFAADDALLNNQALDTASLKTFIVPLLFMAVAVVLSLIYKIVYLVCTYKIFKIFSSQNAVLYLVLSIIFPFLLPVFLFINKDNKPQLQDEPYNISENI